MTDKKTDIIKEVSTDYTPLPEPIPITEQKWPEGTTPLVCTRTMTYNHENYIRECIEGILMQKTTFPVRVCIHDDASTDKTAEIVREYQEKYPHLIWAYYQEENTHRQPNRREMRNEFMGWTQEGKYQALCEGDDYWTDPLKLQKQVEFMEGNKNVAMVYTQAKVFEQINHKFRISTLGEEIHTKGLLYKNTVPTVTTLIRTDHLNEYLLQNKKYIYNFRMGDYPMWIWLYYNSEIYFMDKITSVRRILEESASNFIDGEKQMEFIIASNQISFEYANKYLGEIEIRKLKNYKYKELFKSAIIYDMSNTSIYLKSIYEDNETYFLNKLSLILLNIFKVPIYYIYRLIKFDR